jgi:hypothetical protein
MDRPQHTLTAVALALVLTGCGGSEVEPTGSAPTDANDAAATTEPTTATPSEDPAPTESEDDANDAAATTVPTEPTPYPSDPVAYAEALVVAWAAGDTDVVADLVVDEVELATGTWTTDTAWELERQDALDRFGDVGEGRQALFYTHPGGASMTVTLQTDGMGGQDAVVGLDYHLGTDPTVSFERLDGPVNAYVDTFHDALYAKDEEVLARYGTEQVTEEALALGPPVAGSVITDHGFLAFQGEDLGMIFTYEEQGAPSMSRLLELDPAVVPGGGDDGVVRLDIVTDRRWS